MRGIELSEEKKFLFTQKKKNYFLLNFFF